MTLLTSSRLALLAWSWRRPLLAIGAACLMMPLLIAGMVVQARHEPPGVLLLPVKHSTITQPFGCTTLEIEPWSAECAGHHFHSGVDLAARLGTLIYASTAGTVTVHRERGGYGLYILLTRDLQLSTLYGHLDWPLVQPGDVVRAGQAIALMGSTGNSTGPHLHFEVRIAGVPVDPLPLLRGGG
jgi:murein DD-endopeptidase MepM/ murein hydrolase activator NlpD